MTIGRIYSGRQLILNQHLAPYSINIETLFNNAKIHPSEGCFTPVPNQAPSESNDALADLYSSESHPREPAITSRDAAGPYQVTATPQDTLLHRDEPHPTMDTDHNGSRQLNVEPIL